MRNKNRREFLKEIKPKYEIKNIQPDSAKVISEPIKKIKKEEYTRYIFLYKTTGNYILNKLKEYGELTGGKEYKICNFRIAEYGDWNIIKFEEAIDFCSYHNLVGWFNGFENEPEIPEISFGFARNKFDSQEDYLFFLDPEIKWGDTEIGAFRNGETFSIYLPDAYAYQEYGNLTIKNDIEVSMNEKINFIAEKGLNLSDLDSLNYTEHLIKMIIKN